MAANYLKIFFKIFKETKHDAHYKMIMGNSYVDLDLEDISEQQAMSAVGEEGNTVFDGATVIETSAPVPAALKSEIDQSGFDQEVPF